MDRTRRYVQLSRDIIFEGEMLWRLDTQMLHSHTGFEPYAKEWTTERVTGNRGRGQENQNIKLSVWTTAKNSTVLGVSEHAESIG